MPAFIPIIVGAGASMVAGWAIDEAIGDGEYSFEEAALDGVLGATGAGVVKPVVNIARRGGRARRIVTGKPASSLEGVAMRASGTWSGQPVGMYANASNRIRLAHGLTYVSRGSRRDIINLSKFALISGSHSYLIRNGSGAPVASSPLTHQKSRRPWSNRQRPSGRPSSASKRRKSRAKRARRKKCPSGFYWSWKRNKCVKSKF